MNNRSLRQRAVFCGSAVLLLVASSCSINPYDSAQEPRIAVDTTGDQLMISWEPASAWHVRLLEGSIDPKDPKHSRPPMAGLMWGLSEGTKQSVRSPVRYGEMQEGTIAHGRGLPLERGKTYTVYVLRHDPKGTGDGFTNTRNTYEAVVEFVW